MKSYCTLNYKDLDGAGARLSKYSFAREITVDSLMERKNKKRGQAFMEMDSLREGPSPSKRRDRKENEEKNKGDHPSNKPPTPGIADSPMIKLFQGFQVEIDCRHDKHERIVKLSRDITIESKRTIFLLHRDASGNNKAILEQTDSKLQELVANKFRPLAEELQGEDPYQFLRAYTNGVQEFIEAVSFYFYIKDNRLVSLQEIQKMLDFHAGKDDGETTDRQMAKPIPEFDHKRLCVYVRPVDFLLGVADLTGELMRLAIKSISDGDLDIPFRICNFLRVIYNSFLSFGNTCRETTSKMYTMKQSLEKVETACYMMQVRGSEVPKHALVDVISSVHRESSSFHADF